MTEGGGTNPKNGREKRRNTGNVRGEKKKRMGTESASGQGGGERVSNKKGEIQAQVQIF